MDTTSQYLKTLYSYLSERDQEGFIEEMEEKYLKELDNLWYKQPGTMSQDIINSLAKLTLKTKDYSFLLSIANEMNQP